ncbi:oxidoreductase [Phytomonospora sp. NPDC050363]|uniref:oxidoreductase n=1 Tax=Phytomonospora sp. NPDC050363 TaxID=3155642 RepID=UPI0033EFC3DA
MNWLITGCSTGLGRALAERVLDSGDRVVVTARNPSAIADLAERDNALALRLDVTDPEQISAAVAAAGPVDVLVNNAAYGYLAGIEEGEDAGIRAVFETNVFGLTALTRAVLPGMRERGSGHIVNISSIGGLVVFPAIGYYCATKWAVEAISEALAMEAAPLGVKVTVVEPAGFRTNWAAGSLDVSPVTIPDYQVVAENRAFIPTVTGHQAGDPHRAADAIIEAVRSPEPPLRLLLGAQAVDMLQQRVKDYESLVEVGRDTAAAADFPD